MRNEPKYDEGHGDEGYEEGGAIAIATSQAEKWAERRDKPIKQGEE